MLTLPVQLGLQWLTHSDIFGSDSNNVAQGGIMQGYNWQQRTYPFVYSEITGYGISLFVNAHRWTGDDRYRIMAHQSAGFLMNIQALASGEVVRGAIAHGFSLPGLELRKQYYSFDAAMCLQGLLDLYAHDPTPELLQSARAIGDWLVDRMQCQDGAFLSLYDADTSEWQHSHGHFFDDYGCLHAKHAIGLLKLFLATGEGRYREAASRVCDWVLDLQDDDGAFRATTRTAHVVSHPHCYAAEGLLFAHQVLSTERYLTAARQAGAWLLRAQNRDGSINIGYERRWRHLGARLRETIAPRRVVDATAQAIRIWLILYYLDNNRSFWEASYRAAEFLRKAQCTTSPDENAVGGFYFQPGHPVMFTWATMFAIHALYALENVNRRDGYAAILQELF